MFTIMPQSSHHCQYSSREQDQELGFVLGEAPVSPVSITQPPHFARNEKQKSPAKLNCALGHTLQDQLLLLVVGLKLLVELRDCKLSYLFHIMLLMSSMATGAPETP